MTRQLPATLVGGIVYLGGPPASFSERAAVYQAGVVEVLLNQEVVARKRVAEGEGYSFDLPEGEYTLRVELGDRIETWPVTLIAGKVRHQDAVCMIR